MSLNVFFIHRLRPLRARLRGVCASAAAEGNPSPRLRALLPAAIVSCSLLWFAGAAGAATQIQLSCSSASMAGAGSDACAVTLNAPSPDHRGTTVNLRSSNSAVAVPAWVTIPFHATSASFSADASAVSSPQNVTLIASMRRSSTSFALQLQPAAAALTLGSTNVAFGDIAENTTATQSVSLTSSGTAAVTITAASVTGSEFAISGLNLPVTLNPDQTATLNISFDPTTSGAVTGAVTLTSNASSGSTTTIQLNGTGGGSSYAVDLSWQAPADGSDPAAGYNVYRGTGSGSGYEELNDSVAASTSYTDNSVQDGTTYSYYVTSVDASGNESGPSNIYRVTIP
jgi:hypothetical protein